MRLQELREKSSITQRDLAKALNKSPNEICQYEKRIREPNIASLIKLADFFGVTVDYLIERGGETKMKLYAYECKNGKIRKEEIEVEEKVVLIPKDGQRFPFTYSEQMDRGEVGNLDWRQYSNSGTVFFTEPDFEKAKEMFVEKARQNFDESNSQYEKAKSELDELEKEQEWE